MITRKQRYSIEQSLTRFAFWLFGLLPAHVASALGGTALQLLGPLTGVHRVARKNLRMAMPELSVKQRRRTLRDMWNNLGRVFCEYPHLNSPAMRAAVKDITGLEHLQEALEAKRPVIMVSGHLGNWEMLPVAAHKAGFPIHLLYRAANNVGVDEMLAEVRRPYTLGLHAKGTQSARGLLKAVRSCDPVGVLVDQKTNNGQQADFFGRPAMTVDAIAHFVRKYDALIVPARCIRDEGLRFYVALDAPLDVNAQQTDREILDAMNAHVADWIREDPGQWFWVHRRWGKM